MLSKNELDEAKKLRAQNMPWQKIARQLMLNPRSLRRALDPGFTNQEKSWREGLDDGNFATAKPPLLERDPLLDRLKQGLR